MAYPKTRFMLQLGHKKSPRSGKVEEEEVEGGEVQGIRTQHVNLTLPYY